MLNDLVDDISCRYFIHAVYNSILLEHIIRPSVKRLPCSIFHSQVIQKFFFYFS